MNGKPTRRAFLAGTGMAALAGAMPLKALARAGAPPGARHNAARGIAAAPDAAEARAALDVTAAEVAKDARLLPGCCAYSYDHYLRQGVMTLEDFIRMAVKLKLTAVDMTAYYFRSTHPAYLASLRRLAYKNGIAFSGAACGTRMLHATSVQRQQALEAIRRWIAVADRLGAPHLRIFAGALPPGVSLRQGLDWVVETMRAACDDAGQRGIMVGVEDHNGMITERAEVCLEIMRRVNSPWAGINLDITHFLPAAGDRYRQIAMCAPYATNTHIRAEFDDKEPIDLDRVWRIFVRAGFKGYTSVEYEPDLAHGEDPITGVPRLAARVRALCRRYSSV